MLLNLRAAASLFKALGDRNRLRIVAALARRPACVCELAWALRLKQPNLSRHLRVLEGAGLVESSREGLWINYRLKPPVGATAFVKEIKKLTRDDETLRADGRALARADRHTFAGGCGAAGRKRRAFPKAK